MKLWFCEDLKSPEQSGFGKTKADAQRYVSGNRGYDGYDGSGFKQCVKDEWCKPAVQIDVPKAVVLVLLEKCRI